MSPVKRCDFKFTRFEKYTPYAPFLRISAFHRFSRNVRLNWKIFYPFSHLSLSVGTRSLHQRLVCVLSPSEVCTCILL